MAKDKKYMEEMMDTNLNVLNQNKGKSIETIFYGLISSMGWNIHPWHYTVKVSTGVDMDCAGKVENEVPIQKEVRGQIKKVLEEMTSVKMGMSMYNDGFFEHHFYLTKGHLDLTESALLTLGAVYGIRPFTFEVKYEGTYLSDIVN
ncbi:MAG: hypothetical protein AB3N16_11115 [Flavobacteriaceae bacterium]